MISVVCPAQLLIHDQQIKILLKIVVVFKSRLDVEKNFSRLSLRLFLFRNFKQKDKLIYNFSKKMLKHLYSSVWATTIAKLM